jgi:putative selenium metabolism protein SsnA
MNILLKNATCVVLDPPSAGQVDLRIAGNHIAERGAHLRARKNERTVDLSGRVVMPGFVCAHTHLYSSLARGMAPPAVPPRNFLEILDRIWWRLDRALDGESIYYSAMAGAIEAIQCGTTSLIDHHASPHSIPGSLDIIREVMHTVGLRGVLCYEVTDRGGRKGRDAGLEENERFIRRSRNDRLVRGMVGAHASFTLSEDSLHRCGTLASSLGTGVHIHVAEDLCDTIDSAEHYRSHLVDRLARHGILTSKSILAHCVRLDGGDFPSLLRTKSWLVHNPRSNMNNRVGHAPVDRFGKRAALGTDGFPADMIEEARSGFFFARHARDARRMANMLALLDGGQKLISAQFGDEFGTLKKGSIADLIVLDYVPPTPMHARNLFGHILFGLRSSMVESVMIDGRWVMKNRTISGVNVEEMLMKSRIAAARLWKKMEKIR